MSNLTPQGVDVKLTTTRNELVEEDLRLWEGLEDEKVSRISGDEANKQFTMQVQGENASTESRLSTEVIHRSEGDLTNITSLNALAVALSEYRIKTDLEITNEKIARQQLGVDLNTRVDNFVASWDHDKFLIYQSIQTVQLDVNNKYASMDLRIKKYEDMLQDITMDSIQITMDNGEINMGAWTILSQAREWDLEILGKFKDYKHDTDQGIDEALKDIQDKLPVVEDIINKAIEQLSNAPIIQALDERIGNSEITIDGVTQTVMQHQIDNQNEMIKLAESLYDQVVAESESLNEQLTLETTTRIDALVREATIRAAQLEQEALDRSAEINAKLQVITIDVEQDITNVNNVINELNAELDIQVTNLNNKADSIRADLTAEENARIIAISGLNDGLTQEIQFRKDGDTANIAALENYKTSNDAALANVRVELGANVTATTANATKITSLDTRLVVNETLAATAVSKAETALTENTAQASQISGLNTSIESINASLLTKADASALTALDTKVTNQGGLVTSQGTAITKLTNDLTALNTKTDTKASSSAVSALDSKVTSINGLVTSQGTSITKLTNRMTLAEGTLSKKAESSAVSALESKVTQQGLDITSQGTSITKLTNDLATTNTELTTKASSAALSALDSKVTTQAGITTSQGAAITKLTNDLALTDTAVAKKAEATALSALDTKVTGQGNTLASQGTAITKLTTDLSTLDTKVNTKANSTVVSSLGSKVTSIEGIVTSQGTSLTSLTNRVELAEGNINKKADSSAVTALESKVTQQGLDITSQGASITRIDAAIDATNLAVATKASAAALSALDSKVTSIDGKVSSNTSAITALTGRVTATEGALTTKASVDAVNSLTTRITTAEGTIASQATSITSLNSGLVTTNTNVTAAQTAANKANTLAGGKGKVFFQNAEPAVADSLAQNLWIDTTGNNNTPKRWLTNAWVAVNDKIATDALTAANAANVAVATKADATALSSLDSKVTTINGTVTSQGASITNLNTRLSSAEGALTTKANSSAVSVLDTKVTQQGNTITSQGTDITKLKADLALTNTAVSTKASSEALQSLDNRVVSIDGKVTANASSITALNGKMTTVENGLATKADGSALTALTNRVTSAEGVNTTQSSNITTLTNNLTTTNANVATKADTSAVTALTTRVTNAEGVNTSQGSSITSLTNNLAIANTAINTKASSAAVTALDTKVTAIDGKVSANTNDLTVLKGTVDNNQSYIINNYYTKTDANTATANQITQFKSTLSVGARNLLINSDFRKGLQGWGTYNATLTINSADTIDNKPSSYAFIRGGVGGIYKLHGNIPHVFTTTEDVTFSLMVRGNGRLRLGFNASFKDFTISDTVNWTRITHTQKGVPNSDMVCYLISGTYIDVAYLKVELGSIPTEWSPAPEDDIRDIETTATAVNSLTTKVTNIDGKVSSMASQVLILESFKTNIQDGEIPGNSIREVNLTDPAYDQNMFYPVILSNIPSTSRTHLRIMATLDGGAKPNWASHPGGFSVTVDWELTGAGWGTIDPEQVINNAVWAFTFNNVPPVMDILQDWQTSQPLVWLRGGGKYYYSVPMSRSIAICPPNGTVSSTNGNLYSPRGYDSALMPVSLNQSNKTQGVKLQQTNQVVDGVKAVSTISVDNNGFMSGYGLISQLVNGVVTSAFGINADYFYVGNSNANKKKPFMVLTSPQTIGGVTYPAGTWMDVALIANATIGTAHIADASITNAKIKDLNADKITAGTINSDRFAANSITADKIVIGDGTNLWGNQYFDERGARPTQPRSQWFPYTPQLKGKGVQMWGRDHIAPYSTRIPLKPGDTFVIEFSAGQNSGPGSALGVGLLVYDGAGSLGTGPYQYGAPTVIATLGSSWYRYRRTFTVANNGSGQDCAYGCLYFQIEQGDQEASPAYWTAGDVIVRKQTGGELIVNGAITADKLRVNDLSAVSATIGLLRTSSSGARTEIRDNLIQIYDSSNRVRVKIGVF